MRTSLEKNITSTPRTWEEATRNADYAYSIHGFKSDAKQAWEFLVGALVGAGIIGVIAAIVFGLIEVFA
jgi:F0F1-type ATP synthase assembly protein I